MSQVVLSRGMKKARRRENIAGYIFMAPSLLFFLGFVIIPMGMCLVTSFFNYTMTDFSFIGFQNKRFVASEIHQFKLADAHEQTVLHAYFSPI